jgi:hypothetical protein
MTPNIRWALRFWAICVAAALVLIVVTWTVFSLGFDFGLGALEMTPTAMLALALGTLFSVAIGAGLMALIFYSSRSGSDDTARGPDER